MAVSRDEVLRIARLARLALTEKEVTSFLRQLNDILDYMDVLRPLDTEHIEPFRRAASKGNTLRRDAPRESMPREKALNAAPSSDGEYFTVPNIMPSKRD